MSDLRQKVAKALCCNDGKCVFCDEFCVAEQFLTEADIAIALVLEEAAQACEEQQAVFLSDQYAVNQPLSSIKERFACKQCAAAIRALGEKP